MILKKIVLTNYRGVNGSVTIDFKPFNCIVGQNDAGKSTILKALDVFLNEVKPSRADLNYLSTDSQFSIELLFDCQKKQYLLGEQISTTIEEEELVNQDNLLVIKKLWTVTETNVTGPKTYIKRKKYEGTNDFILKTEPQLMALCDTNGIATTKGNGEQFNNVEKREKLREYNRNNSIQFTYEYEEVPSSGQSKFKAIGDSIKRALPIFQYFKADTSLSDTDTTIQRYFKDMAYKLINEQIDTDDIESQIKTQLETILGKITDKINEVVKTGEKVEPKVDFDWGKLISTSFISTSSGNPIPLTSRGDGFRRITMMSYFEYLTETQRVNTTQKIIFGFEEPETFLHPSAQHDLFDKLFSLSQNSYQVIACTHSPTIVSKAKLSDITHISRINNIYTVRQSVTDFKDIATDLGIKPDNTFTPLFSSSRLLFLVEGISDANAMHHTATCYKRAGLISETFEELNISIIPIGGCGSIGHWVNLDLLTKLEKPFFIFLDSDKETATAISPNDTKLRSYGLTLGTDFLITRKRLLENYIHPTALKRLVPSVNINHISYSDFQNAKNFCKDYPDSAIRGKLGGAGVAERHYTSLTFDELRLTWNDITDEFVELYNAIIAKLN